MIWWNQHKMIKWKKRDVWYGLALSCGTVRQELMLEIARQEFIPGTAPTSLQVDQPARSSCLGQPLMGFHTWDNQSGAHLGTALKGFYVKIDSDDDWGIDLDSPEPERKGKKIMWLWKEKWKIRHETIVEQKCFTC